MDKNKYLDAIANTASECAKELISLLLNKKVSKLTFSSEDEEVEYIPTICFYDDYDNAVLCDLTELELVTNEGEPYIKISGENDWGVKSGAYIDKDGGEYYDLEHSLGKIYAAVLEKLGLAD
jgi:hypothetical protein